MKNLLIVGAGGHGKVVADTAQAMQCWDNIAFVDDRYPNIKQCLSFPVVGKFCDVQLLQDKYNFAVVAIGDNYFRVKLVRQLGELGYRLSSIIHPSAVVSQYSTIADGVVILANSVISASSSVGLACIVNARAGVGHDNTIGVGVQISPNSALAGNVSIDNYSWIGMGATVIEGVRIGKNTIVGLGSVVLKNLADDIVVAGVPAKIIKRRELIPSE